MWYTFFSSDQKKGKHEGNRKISIKFYNNVDPGFDVSGARFVNYCFIFLYLLR